MNKNKILLIDDEVNIRETVTELLIYENYNVKTAANGQEALELLEDWRPDLIISDIMMPVMDGHLLHEIIRENNTLAAIPFIFLSAKKELDIMRRCLLDGADDFLSKPFKVKELTGMIQTKIKRFEKINKVYHNLHDNKNYLAHEINTPLNGILGSIDLLIESGADFEKNEIAAFYDAIKMSGERLNRTMFNVLLYENYKNNKLDLPENEISEIYEVFSKVKSKILESHHDQDSRINFKIENAILRIGASYLSFVLYELLDNALKFSSKTKEVAIIGLRFNELYYELSITDFGIGFSPEDLKKIDATNQFHRDVMEQ